MENLATLSTKLPILVAPPRPTGIFHLRRPCRPVIAAPARRAGGIGGGRPKSIVVAAHRRGSSTGAPRRISDNILEKMVMQDFASISSSSSSGTSAVGGSQQPILPPPSSSIGSPLFWIGIGVGLSALFSVVTTKVKAYAMQQFIKSLSQTAPQDGPFSNAAFSSGSPFPFPAAPPSPQTATPPTLVSSQPFLTVDVPATKVEVPSPAEARDQTFVKEPNKYTFVDVSPEVLEDVSEYPKGPEKENATVNINSEKEVSSNGAAFKQEKSASYEQSQSRRPKSGSAVVMFEKMLEDPTVQKMIYPLLPEEMRNPTMLKWMLQNPEYRRQLEDMLDNVAGSSDWDSRVLDSMKNFDLSSPEVKQQFDRIGLTPEEVMSRIMTNPEVALAFQNPKVQAAMMDVSQNPLSFAKYQNDKEVMDAFNKISELFPGVSP